MNVGQHFELTMTVTEAHTAKTMGSGGMVVLATPCLVAWLENAAMNCVQGAIGEGNETVGTMINLEHIAATAVGKNVCAKAVLTAIDGRKLTFELEAHDEKGKIGFGTHTRVVVDREKFLARTRG